LGNDKSSKTWDDDRIGSIDCQVPPPKSDMLITLLEASTTWQAGLVIRCFGWTMSSALQLELESLVARKLSRVGSLVSMMRDSVFNIRPVTVYGQAGRVLGQVPTVQ
jgi:hypothetical protein